MCATGTEGYIPHQLGLYGEIQWTPAVLFLWSSFLKVFLSLSNYPLWFQVKMNPNNQLQTHQMSARWNRRRWTDLGPYPLARRSESQSPGLLLRRRAEDGWWGTGRSHRGANQRYTSPDPRSRLQGTGRDTAADDTVPVDNKQFTQWGTSVELVVGGQDGVLFSTSLLSFVIGEFVASFFALIWKHHT